MTTTDDWSGAVTFLSVLANHAIALPLSPSFPAHELRYILDHSEAKILLSSNKLQEKADEVVKEGLEHKPIIAKVEKINAGSTDSEGVKMEDVKDDQGGLMLYTSGTTSRPVSHHDQMHRTY